MSIKNKTSNSVRRAIYNEAKKYFDVKAMFPKSEAVGRAPLTDYQLKKVKKELNALTKMAGGRNHLERDFIKVRRTKSAIAYIEKSGLASQSKGILLAGGISVNSNISIRGGALHYLRGMRPQMQYPINAVSEKTMLNDLRGFSGFVNNPANNPYIATAGGKINAMPASVDATLEGDDAINLLCKLASKIYNKYSDGAAAGLMRREGTKHATKMVHPSKWGLSLLIEAK